MELLTSTRLCYALTAACNNGASHTGRLTPLSSICSLFAFSLPSIHGLEPESIDFILAFPQADLDVDIWMELPTGIVVSGKDNESRA